MESETSIPQDIEMRDKNNPCVFMDISIDGTYAGKMVIELYKDTWPIVAENFRALCTGEKGKGKTGKPLHYKDTVFYHIEKRFFTEGGDIEKNNGEGGESSFGGTFKVDNDKRLVSSRGMLYMVHYPLEIDSKFIIVFNSIGFMHASMFAVVGKVIQGMKTLEKIEQLGTDTGRTTGLVKITNCGEISQDKVSDKGEKENSGKRAVSSDNETNETVFKKQCGSIVKFKEVFVM